MRCVPRSGALWRRAATTDSLLGDWWLSVLLEQVIQRLDEEVLSGSLELDGEDPKLLVCLLIEVRGD